MSSSAWDQFVGKGIVVDTTSQFIYLGELQRYDDTFLYLDAVDVHDHADSSSTKEKYVMESFKSGVQKNRHAVAVRLDFVVSVSLLEDVISY